MYRKSKIKNKNEMIALMFLLIVTVTATSYDNFTQKKRKNNYNEIKNRNFFKKTANHFLNRLEPRFKKIRHQISEGETFDNILDIYQIDSKEIQNIKSKLIKKINLNKLNTNQKIHLTSEQANNKIKEFIFQVSNKERVLLTRNEKEDNLNQEILLTK